MSISGISVVLCLFGAIQGLFLALALISAKRGNRMANRLLAALVLTASIAIFGGVMRSQNYVAEVPHLSRVHDPFLFLIGPLLFLYLAALIGKKKTFVSKDLLHFVLFALCVVYLLPYYLLSAPEKFASIQAEWLDRSVVEWYYIRTITLIAQFLVYLVIIVRMVGGYFKTARERSTPVDPAIKFEIKYLVISTTLLWIVGVLRYALGPDPSTNIYSLLGASIAVYGLGYVRLVKPELLNGTEAVRSASAKYESSTLSSRQSDIYLKKLLDVMLSEKLYTDCELSLPKVAEHLSISPHHLSQVVNERLNQSFSDFVNSYRVDEVKKMLIDPAKKYYSILALAEEAGFNSKSSFNTVFKKHTNTTPSEFREKFSEVQDDNSARP